MSGIININSTSDIVTCSPCSANFQNKFYTIKVSRTVSDELSYQRNRTVVFPMLRNVQYFYLLLRRSNLWVVNV